MDIIHEATKTLDHNRGTVLGIAVLIGSITLAGCSAFDGKTISSSSGELLNGDELQGEYVQASSSLRERLDKAQTEIIAVSAASDRLDAGFRSDIDKVQQEITARSDLFGQVGTLVSSTASVPWLMPLLTIGSGAMAGGVGWDNRRKNKIINESKASA